MDSNKITTHIKSTSHEQIMRKINYLVIVLSIIAIFAGGITLYTSTVQDENEVKLSMLFFVLGITLITIGIIYLCTKSKYDVYKETGSPTKLKKYYFNKKNMGILKEALVAGSFDQTKSVAFVDNGDAHMEVILSKDNAFSVVQLFEISSFSEEIVTPVYYFTGTKASALSAYLKRCEKEVSR